VENVLSASTTGPRLIITTLHAHAHSRYIPGTEISLKLVNKFNNSVTKITNQDKKIQNTKILKSYESFWYTNATKFSRFLANRMDVTNNRDFPEYCNILIMIFLLFLRAKAATAFSAS